MQDSRDRRYEMLARLGRETQRKKRETKIVYLTKRIMAKPIAKNYDLPEEVVRAIIDDCFYMIRDALMSGIRVMIDDFGVMLMNKSKKISFRMNRNFKMLAKNEGSNKT